MSKPVQPSRPVSTVNGTQMQGNDDGKIANNVGYPDMNSYGNKNNYLNAPARQTMDIIPDEDFGYYAANGRNVSVRVDMNTWLIIYTLLISTPLLSSYCYFLFLISIIHT